MSGRRRATATEVMRAVGLRERGWKLLDIAVALGVSEATVSRWCRGLTRRQVTGSLKTGSRFTTDDARVHSSPAGLDAILPRFARQMDPDGTLAPEERARRAAHARKANMTTPSLRVSRASAMRRAQEPDRVRPGADVATSGPAKHPVTPRQAVAR